jgi:hypothetical protein
VNCLVVLFFIALMVSVEGAFIYGANALLVCSSVIHTQLSLGQCVCVAVALSVLGSFFGRSK